MDLTVRDAAAIFDVTEGRIYRWIVENDLPGREIDGKHYFNRAELLEWATVRRIRFCPELFRNPLVLSDGLADAVRVGGILRNVAGSTRSRALCDVVDRMSLPDGFDRAVLHELFVARESLGSTAVGDGIAIPHPRYPVVLPGGRSTVALAFLGEPMDFGASDRRLVHTLFVSINPTVRAHLRMLARIACVVRDKRVRSALEKRQADSELLKAIRCAEESILSDSSGREASD